MSRKAKVGQCPLAQVWDDFRSVFLKRVPSLLQSQPLFRALGLCFLICTLQLPFKFVVRSLWWETMGCGMRWHFGPFCGSGRRSAVCPMPRISAQITFHFSYRRSSCKGSNLKGLIGLVLFISFHKDNHCFPSWVCRSVVGRNSLPSNWSMRQFCFLENSLVTQASSGNANKEMWLGKTRMIGQLDIALKIVVQFLIVDKDDQLLNAHWTHSNKDCSLLPILARWFALAVRSRHNARDRSATCIFHIRRSHFVYLRLLDWEGFKILHAKRRAQNPMQWDEVLILGNLLQLLLTLWPWPHSIDFGLFSLSATSTFSSEPRCYGAN